MVLGGKLIRVLEREGEKVREVGNLVDVILARWLGWLGSQWK